MTPASELRRLIAERGWKQADVVDIRRGRDRNAISEIANGRRRISPAMSSTLAAIFQVPADYFLRLQVEEDLRNTPERDVEGIRRRRAEVDARKFDREQAPMASKKVCDICGADTAHSLWVWDGGTQIDPPSGRTEETGGNFDFCNEHLLKAYRTAVGSCPDAQRIFAKFLTGAMGWRWRG